MRDAVLAIVGTIGIAALVMSMNSENKKVVKEDFLAGFGFKTKVQKVVQNKNGGENALQVDVDPNVRCKSNQNQKENQMKPKMVENYSNSKHVGSGLGSSDVTKMPFISTATYNQNVNQPSPSLNLPAYIRYNAPSLSNMGITENFQQRPSSTRENYETSATCGTPNIPYMSSNSNYPYPGPNYSATPIPKAEMVLNHPEDNLAKAGEVNIFGEEVMVFDRPMTTTLKVGRFAGRGTRDLIRGDLPVAPNTHCGWFSTPADPSALSKGALQAIAGENESSTVLNKFMEIYGDVSSIGAGVNLNDPNDSQYTALEMITNANGTCGNTVQVNTF